MEEQLPPPLEQLPFRWSAVRYTDPNTKHAGQKNLGHLRMDESFEMGAWKKEAGYILCASPVTTRDTQYWQGTEQVTCISCLGRVTWFLERYAVFQQQGTRRNRRGGVS